MADLGNSKKEGKMARGVVCSRCGGPADASQGVCPFCNVPYPDERHRLTALRDYEGQTCMATANTASTCDYVGPTFGEKVAELEGAYESAKTKLGQVILGAFRR